MEILHARMFSLYSRYALITTDRRQDPCSFSAPPIELSLSTSPSPFWGEGPGEGLHSQRRADMTECLQFDLSVQPSIALSFAALRTRMHAFYFTESSPGHVKRGRCSRPTLALRTRSRWVQAGCRGSGKATALLKVSVHHRCFHSISNIFFICPLYIIIFIFRFANDMIQYRHEENRQDSGPSLK